MSTKMATKAATKVVAAKMSKVVPKSVITKPVVTKAVIKEELVHSHPTMCLHCHLIVEMFHEKKADPVKGSWQCPRCGHKYLFSHWKIKRQVRSKTEAA